MSTALHSRPRSVEARALGGAVLFWLSSLAVGAATFVVLAVLSPHLPAGGLAAVSVVLGLSYVLAVPPGAIQLRAAAAASSPGRQLTLRPPRLVAGLSAALLVVAPLAAAALKIPLAAVVLASVQLPLAAALGSARGTLIGQRCLTLAAASFGIDAACRLFSGAVLGIVWGASGVAAALLLATALALLAARPRAQVQRPAASAGPSSMLSYMLAVSVIVLLTNVDVLLGPRVLGAGADGYAVAALPAKGIFFALFSVSWLAVSFAVNARTSRQLLAPAAFTLGLGLSAAGAVLLARPLLPELFGRGEPSLAVLAPLALAMAIAGTTSVVVSMAVARGARQAWTAPLAAVLALATTTLVLRPDAPQLALGVLLGQLAALGGGTWALLRSLRPGELDRPADATIVVAPATSLPTAATAAPHAARPAFPRRTMLLVCGLLTAACFTQAPGDIVADTKLDLYVDPLRFMSTALHLWDPTAAFGQIQDQAVGYLFPMGPFFAATAKAGLPVWIAQRLWMGLLLSLAVWGTGRLAAALRIGTPLGWVLGGLSYGLSAFFVGQLASSSVGLLAAALAPWSILPLIAAARGDSRRRAAALSGLAVLAMGGVNAACTLAVLPLPALYILTRKRSRARSSLLGWWLLAVVLACAWWAVPLVFEGWWGFDFIRFTETGATTQSTTSAFEVLRGTGNWVSYLHLGHAWLPAGWSLATAPLAILASAAVATAGLAGLASRALPERRFLVGSFAIGVLCVGAGYAGPAAGIAGHEVQSLLSGSLAALRNTYKFEPVVILPLALGLTHLLAKLGTISRRRLRGPHVVRIVRFAGAAALTGVVLIGAMPFAERNLVTAGPFRSIPSYWYQLADYLHAHAGRTRALLLPSSAFGEYRWGRPLDEPLEALARSPWAVRNLIPLGGMGSTELLDAVEAEIVDGHASPHLGQALARAGISYVVARNDLAWQRTGSPPPAKVSEALLEGGLLPVASFGPSVPGDQGVAALELPAARQRVPSLQVYAVHAGASVVASYPEADPVVLDGGPQSLVQLAGAPWLQSRAAVLASDLPTARLSRGDVWAVSDASRRVAQDFGLVESNYSYTLAAGEQAPGPRASGLKVIPPAPGAEQAVAVYRHGVASVTASSYGSWLQQLPELAPSNAFDGDPATAWVAGDVGRSRQWVQARFTAPVSISHVGIRLLEDGPWRPVVRRITITTQAGSLTSPVQDTEAQQTVPVRAGRTSYVRVTLSKVTGQSLGGADAGLRDVVVPGVDATARSSAGGEVYVQPPEQPGLLASSAGARALPSFAFTRLTADPSNLLRRDPEAQFARLLELPVAASMRVTASALPAAGTRLDDLLSQTRGLLVSASSSWGSLPAWRPANAVDGNAHSAWIAAPPSSLPPELPSAPGVGGSADVNITPRVSPVPAATDSTPTLYLSWAQPRTLSALRVTPPGGFAAPPTTIRLESPAGTRIVRVSPHGGLVRFAALRTDRLAITFPGVAARYTTDAGGARLRLPVGVAELDFPALRSLQPLSLPARKVVHLPCGEGPPVTVDGRRLATSVTATVADITALGSLPISLCTPGHAVSMQAGTNSIFSPDGGAFTIAEMELTPAHGPPVSSAPARSVSIVRWGADSREVHVGAGPATYLAVRENFNAGWTATLAGHRLRAIRLDGWEQGFIVPRGKAADVTLRFSDDNAYRTALLVGAALVLVLVLLALLPARRGRGVAEALAPSTRHGRALGALVGAGVVIATGLISWPALLALPPLAFLARRRRGLLGPLAAGAMLAAAAVVALDVVPIPADGRGTFGAAAQILAGIAVAAVLMTLVVDFARGEAEPS